MRRTLPVLFEAPDEPLATSPIEITDDLTPAQLTRRVILGAKKYTFPAALLSIVHQVGEALVPVVMGLAIDRALGTGSPSELVLWIAILGLDFAMLSYAYRFGSRIGYLGMQSVQHRLRMMVSDRLLHPSGVKGPASLPGVSLSVATNDVYMLAASMQIGIYPVGEIAGVAFCAVMLLTMSWQLGLAVIIGAPLMLIIMGVAGRPLQRRSESQQGLAAQAVGTAADLVGGYRVLKGVGAEREAASRYEDVSKQALAGTLHAKNAQGTYTGTMHLISGVFIAALAIGAGLQATSGQLTVGELIAVVGLTQFLIGPLRAFATNVGAVWAMSMASATRVLSVLQAPPVLAPRPVHSRNLREGGELVFELKDVRLPGTSGFALRVEPDEYVGVLATAEQARTLVDLLAARAHHADGRFLIDGVDASSIGPDALAARVVVAPHSADLFDGTIEENVRLDGVDADRLAAAFAAAGCDEIIETLPRGALTEVGEGGTRLSGGQRQRVALARALASDASLLVLHDPTTAVDSVTEAGIAAGIRGVRKGNATLVITSSPVLLADCDRVIDLRGESAS